jgi:uncharacterized protein
MNPDQRPDCSTQTPFIKKFKQGGFYYIYDVNTNQIIEVEEDVYKFIDIYTEGQERKLETPADRLRRHSDFSRMSKAFEKIANAREKYGLFSNFRPEKVLLGMRTADQIKKFHNKNFNQLLLELTTNCTLNCTYCNVSGKYAQRDRVPTDMSRETIWQSVDYFYENSRNTTAPSISFYGGEPLIKFNTIKEVVNCVSKKIDGDKYNFNLTINGTIFNKEIADFFIEHDFAVNVSLDGPEHVNDRYRHSRKGGGSFETIKRNLQFLKSYNPGYFSDKVSISCVLAPPFDKIDDTIDFFSSDETFDELRLKGKIRSSRVNTSETSFIEDLGLEKSIKQYSKVSDYFTERIKSAILSHDLSLLTIERRQMEGILHNLARRGVKRLYNHYPPLGACHIGLKRIFVKTNGDFYICERSGSNYKIGDVENGLDYGKIAEYYRKLEEATTDCKDCWALSHCERCWVRIGNVDEFNGERKKNFCQTQKMFIEKAFKVYAELLREDPECLKILNDAL